MTVGMGIDTEKTLMELVNDIKRDEVQIRFWAEESFRLSDDRRTKADNMAKMYLDSQLRKMDLLKIIRGHKD